MDLFRFYNQCIEYLMTMVGPGCRNRTLARKSKKQRHRFTPLIWTKSCVNSIMVTNWPGGWGSPEIQQHSQFLLILRFGSSPKQYLVLPQPLACNLEMINSTRSNKSCIGNPSHPMKFYLKAEQRFWINFGVFYAQEKLYLSYWKSLNFNNILSDVSSKYINWKLVTFHAKQERTRLFFLPLHNACNKVSLN